jgi:hypothetical protein
VGGNVDAAPGAQQPLANALPVLPPLTESPVSSITSSLASLRLCDERGAAVATEVTPLGDVGVASPSISALSGDVAPPGFPMAAPSKVESMAPSGGSVSVGPLPGAYHADLYASEFVDTQCTSSVDDDDDDSDSVKDESDNEDDKYWTAVATRRVPRTPSPTRASRSSSTASTPRVSLFSNRFAGLPIGTTTTDKSTKGEGKAALKPSMPEPSSTTTTEPSTPAPVNKGKGVDMRNFGNLELDESELNANAQAAAFAAWKLAAAQQTSAHHVPGPSAIPIAAPVAPLMPAPVPRPASLAVPVVDPKGLEDEAIQRRIDTAVAAELLKHKKKRQREDEASKSRKVTILTPPVTITRGSASGIFGRAPEAPSFMGAFRPGLSGLFPAGVASATVPQSMVNAFTPVRQVRPDTPLGKALGLGSNMDPPDDSDSESESSSSSSLSEYEEDNDDEDRCDRRGRREKSRSRSNSKKN